MGNKNDKWSALSMSERADLIKLYVNSGISSLAVMREDYNGAPYSSFNSSEYDYFNAHPSNAPTEKGEHWTSRNPKTGQLLKRDDHPTFDLMIEGEKQAGYNIVKGLDGSLYSVPNGPNNYVETYNSFSDGGPTGEGGYSSDSEEKRWDTFWSYDPAGGTGLSQLLYLSQGNQSRGEENEYWKAYLGLPNAVPEMNTNAKTSWDDAVEKEKITRGELPSDFYGTTPRMDLNIQAIADTLNTGKIVRNYKQYKKANPNLPPKMIIENMYEAGKQVLENPNTWQQVDGDITGIKRGLDPKTNEFSPLGMLANFGMMWSPEENALYMHDTYDFNKLGTKIVGKRPKEMKIRSKISFDPIKGSVLLRDDMANFNDYPEPLKK